MKIMNSHFVLSFTSLQVSHDRLYQYLGALSCVTGDTALHIAARWLRWVCLERLLNGGADINLRNEQGETPLDVAWNAVIKNKEHGRIYPGDEIWTICKLCVDMLEGAAEQQLDKLDAVDEKGLGVRPFVFFI